MHQTVHSAVGYGVTLTCVAVACSTLRTVVAAAALLVVGRRTAHCLECFYVVNRVLSADDDDADEVMLNVLRCQLTY